MQSNLLTRKGELIIYVCLHTVRAVVAEMDRERDGHYLGRDDEPSPKAVHRKLFRVRSGEPYCCTSKTKFGASNRLVR